MMCHIAGSEDGLIFVVAQLRKTLVWEPQNVGLYTLLGGARGSEKVYCLYTHENVNIFGRPLTSFIVKD